MPYSALYGRGVTLPLTILLLTASRTLSATPVSLDLDYTCVFPILEEQPMSVTINAEIPSRAETGQATPLFKINATATVNDTSWNGLDFVGTATLSGNVKAAALISGPALDLDLSVPLEIEPIDLPATRTTFDVKASGTTPPLTFTRENIGDIKVTVGDIVMKLTAKDANGNLTGLGPIESECLLLAGQDDLLQTIEVTGPGTDEQALNATGSGALELSNTGTPVPLTTAIAATVSDVVTDANLTVRDTNTNIRIISLFNTLSLDTSIRFESAGNVTGFIDGGLLTLNAPVHLQLPKAQLRLFGLKLSDGGGEQCRTTEPATMTLTAADSAWDSGDQPFTLSGTIDIPRFQNCGSVTNLVNRQLAGSGQSLELQMTPVTDNGQRAKED